MKKLSVLGLAVVLLVSMAAGVWAGGGSSSSSATGAGANFNATGMPIVNTQVELRALTMRWPGMDDSFSRNTWMVELERRSNVRIRWEVVSFEGWSERKAIMLASQDLPDIGIGNMTFNDADIMNNLDFFLPLDDLISRYMPKYSAAIQRIPALRQIATFPDGKMYSLAKNLPSRPATRNHLIINKTWLDRLGLAVPTTVDEFTAVLRAFKTRDANGNGNVNDEYPMSFSGNVHVDMLNPFGITDINATQMSIIDGRLFHWPSSPEYRAAITWMRQLWQEGLIDPESFTQDSTMLSGKRLNTAAPLVGTSWEWTPDAVFGGWSNQYVAVPPLAGPNGRRYAGGDKDGVFSIARNEAVITRNARMPEVAARYLDEYYDSEASIQNFWGPIGTVITKNSDNTYTLNNPPSGTSADAWYWASSLRDFGPKYIEPGFDSRIRLDPTAGDGLKMEITKMGDPYVTEPFPNVIYTSRELDELAIIQMDLDSFINQTQARWVTQGGIDAEWDNYIRQLNTMGLQRFIEIRTAAYNRYRGR